MPARDTIITLFSGSYLPYSLREISDVLHSGFWEGGSHVGVPDGHSPHWGSYCVHVGNPSGFVLDYVGTIHCCHCGFCQHIWLPYLRGASMRAGEGDSLSKQAATPLKPGVGATFGMGSGDPGDDSESYFCYTACLHSSTLQHWTLLPPTLWLQHLCLNSPRVREISLAEVASWVGCSTSI